MYEEFVFLKKNLKQLEGDKYTLNYLVSENKSSLPNDNLSQDNADLDDEIPF